MNELRSRRTVLCVWYYYTTTVQQYCAQYLIFRQAVPGDVMAAVRNSQDPNRNPHPTVQSKVAIVAGFDVEMVCTVLRMAAVISPEINKQTNKRNTS